MSERENGTGEQGTSAETGMIIFTDLDGTLLDRESYAFDQARFALGRIRDLAVPLIITTSKTRAEVEVLQCEMGIEEPFITENGGGVFFPRLYRGFRIKGAFEKGAYQCLCLGRSYEAIREFLNDDVKGRLAVRGFGDLSVEELMVLANLSRQEAERARRREFAEPLWIGNPGDIPRLADLAGRAGLTLTKGDRFYHLIDRRQDKGKAVKKGTDIFRANLGQNVRTVGIGGSRNDLPMLENVDVPVLIPHPDGHYEETGLLNPRKAPYPGSRGWNAAVMELFDDFTRNPQGDI